MKLDLGWGIEREWSKALKGLVLPDKPLTPEVALREYVEQVRGNRLVMTRDPLVASPNGPSGMWVTKPGVNGAPGVDVVWVHPSASGGHERRIVAHEWGHMVNGDEPDPVDLKGMVRLLQSLCADTPASWTYGMCRTDFSDPRERRAEDFSYFAEGWLARNTRPEAGLAASMRECIDTRGEYR